MSGIIFVPTKNARNRFISYGRYLSLFDYFIENHNFKYSEELQCDPLSIEEDTVIIFKAPEYHSPDLLQDMYKLPSSKNLIGYFTDIHTDSLLTGSYTDDDKIYIENMTKILERCDIILCPYRSPFLKLWPQFINKFILFPQFSNYWSDNINNTSINKILLSGNIGDWYPLRLLISDSKLDTTIKLIHPGYDLLDYQINPRYCSVGLDYFNTLLTYAGGIATGGIMNYITAKHFEIPAVGSLLLAPQLPDLKELGFLDGINYISIDKSNFKERIEDVVYNPEDYLEIRKAGHTHILSHFCLPHRIKQLESILELYHAKTK